MSYDIWGRTSATSVDTQALPSNTYDSYGRLISVVYGNGYRTEYSYDALDRVASVSRGTGSNVPLAFTYTYDGEGNLYELRNFETHRSTVFRYDHAGRCMASVEKTFTGSGNGISYTGTAVSYRYEYDACDRLSKLTCGTGSDTWETVYTYDNDGKAKTVTLQNGKVLTNTYDSLGRLQYRDIGLNSNYRTALTYLAGAGGSSTALLATYTNGSDDAYSYTYDANGNITEITQGSTSVSYSYNAANELVRENNGFTGETVLYSYDPWGNILEKVTYAYTTAEEPQSPSETVIYSYGNTVWHDELTGLSTTTAGGTETETFTYDNNGNALTYRGASLTWDGKQLASYSKGADTLSFSYDENGLRLSKTHNNETTSYYYNGSVLMSLVKGNDTLLFSYDQGGNVISVNYNGTDYYYLRNGQNDIVKLIDGSGNTVVEYSYNSWGEQTGCVGTLSTTLGVLNPFRYRGYVYDEETGLYYLQSRYYDPSLCRFISADIYLSTGQGVIGCNAFAYCANEPVSYSDEMGTILVWFGEIHQAVERKIADELGCSKEKRIDYLSGGWGRADLLDESTGEIWEIKPDNERQIRRGVRQVERYIGGELHEHKGENIRLKIGNRIKENSFNYPSGDITYEVTYRYAGDGVIAYSYHISDINWDGVANKAGILAGVAFGAIILVAFEDPSMLNDSLKELGQLY